MLIFGVMMVILPPLQGPVKFMMVALMLSPAQLQLSACLCFAIHSEVPEVTTKRALQCSWEELDGRDTDTQGKHVLFEHAGCESRHPC